MISVEHMQELIDRFNSLELDIRDIIEQSYFGGRADAIDEFMKSLLDGFNVVEWNGKNYKIELKEKNKSDLS